MTKYALDTNIVTYYLKGNKTIIARVVKETDNGNSIIIPPTVFYEIKRWLLTVNSDKRLALFETICSVLLIASYCIRYDLTLVTNNEQHFKYIANLRET